MGDVNRVVIVTGSSSGMGYDIARAFLERGAGVVINGRDAERLGGAASRLARLAEGERVVAVAGDIGVKATGEALVKAAVEHFGRVEVLVNNAGTFVPRPFLEVTEAELDSYLDGNLRGTYLTTQAVVRQLEKQGRGGSIINIGTVLVDHAMASLAASAPLVSKGGVHALTMSLAAELAPHRIRVNAVAPGVIRTPLYGHADIDSFAGAALLNRVGEVEETTEAVLYLADAGFITGHILRVDGGYVTGRA